MEPLYDYARISTRSLEEMNLRASLIELELEEVFKNDKPEMTKEQLMIAIVGVPDRRLISTYAASFERLLERPSAIVVFDKITDHLMGMPAVIKHDAVQPFPIKPFNLVYSHDLLRFIKHENQAKVLKNSYDSLDKGGLSVHILDEEVYSTSDERLPDMWYSVDLENLKNELKKSDISLTEMDIDVSSHVPKGLAYKIRGVKGKALLLKKP